MLVYLQDLFVHLRSLLLLQRLQNIVCFFNVKPFSFKSIDVQSTKSRQIINKLVLMYPPCEAAAAMPMKSMSPSGDPTIALVFF